MKFPNNQATDHKGNPIIEGARISHYLGSTDTDDRYVLVLPKGTFFQPGPWVMEREYKGGEGQ